jgi:hypothetical protein
MGLDVDDDPGAVPRPHAARKDLPVEQQDTRRIRVRARIFTRRRQAHQIHLVCVSFHLFCFFKILKTACNVASNPPPRDLKVSDPDVRDLTLAELGLAPSSVLLLRFVDDALNRAFSPLRVKEFGLD